METLRHGAHHDKIGIAKCVALVMPHAFRYALLGRTCFFGEQAGDDKWIRCGLGVEMHLMMMTHPVVQQEQCSCEDDPSAENACEDVKNFSSQLGPVRPASTSSRVLARIIHGPLRLRMAPPLSQPLKRQSPWSNFLKRHRLLVLSESSYLW